MNSLRAFGTLGIAALLLLSGPAAFADSTPASGEQVPTECVDWCAYLPGTGEYFIPGEAPSIWEDQTSSEHDANDPSPFLLAPDDWIQCWWFNNDSWAITSFTAGWDGELKEMALQCGFHDSATGTGQGYKHIAYGHEEQWRDRITQAQPGANTDSWGDLMWNVASRSWFDAYDSSGPYNGKLCIAGYVEMYGPNPSGQIVKKYTFYPTFSWSLTNDRLITAIPSSASGC